ncbi:MAG: Thymidylate kinase [Desulfovibrio sp.]
MRGMFITFEGMEGSGKSTVMMRTGRWLEQARPEELGPDRWLEQARPEELGSDQWLEQARPEVVYTREPGGSKLGRELRAILLDARNADIVPRAELFLYLADRAQHAATVIRPALERGAFVLSDRFADSTVAYQGYGRGLDIESLHGLNAMAVDGVWPDITILVDVDAATGIARANARNAAEGKTVSEGRFEAESLAFHTAVREGFLDMAAKNPQRFAVLDGTASPDEVFAAAKDIITARLKEN